MPVQCIVDLLANAYNSDAPSAVEGIMQKLEPLIQDSPLGLAVDLDALLQVLIGEIMSGICEWAVGDVWQSIGLALDLEICCQS